MTAVQTGQKAVKQKRYVYYDQLQFLIPHVKGNTHTSSNIELPASVSDDNTDIDTSLVTDGGNNDDFEPFSSQVQSPRPTTNTIKKRQSDSQYSRGKKIAIEKSVAESAKNLTTILSESLQIQREQRQREQQADKFGHGQFLSSFVPILDGLPLHAAMQARIEISQAVSRIVQGTHNIASRPNPEFDEISTIISDEDNSTTSFELSKYINL